LKELGLGQPYVKPVEKKSFHSDKYLNEDFSGKQKAPQSLVVG